MGRPQATGSSRRLVVRFLSAVLAGFIRKALFTEIYVHTVLQPPGETLGELPEGVRRNGTQF
ncbi:hypothetical protein MJO29_016688 [Puccinia striiformis f. sp. tritici]|nr:hypothetical protein MJO29_016688 [Puccinia striiformis f. sp. tritici]